MDSGLPVLRSFAKEDGLWTEDRGLPAWPHSIIFPRLLFTISNCPTVKPSGTVAIYRKSFKNNALRKDAALGQQKKSPIDGGTIPPVNLLTKNKQLIRQICQSLQILSQAQGLRTACGLTPRIL